MDFAIIVHPIRNSDIYCRFPLTRFLPTFLMESFLRILPPLMPPRRGKKSNSPGVQGNLGISGHLVGCPLTTQQLLQLPSEAVLHKVVNCVRLAQKNGARIVGLDGVTALAADKVKVAQLSEVPVTVGESLTVVMALESARMAAREMGLAWHNTNVALLGAENPMGSVFAQIIAREVGSLTLLARRKGKQEKLVQEILYETGLAVKQRDISPCSLESADMVIILEPFSDLVLDPAFFRKGAIVCDFLAPYGTAERLANGRKDILVIRGALVEIPGLGELDSPFCVPGVGLSPLMAETILLLLENKEGSVLLGKEISVNQVEEMGQLARKYGIRVSGFI